MTTEQIQYLLDNDYIIESKDDFGEFMTQVDVLSSITLKSGLTLTTNEYLSFLFTSEIDGVKNSFIPTTKLLNYLFDEFVSNFCKYKYQPKSVHRLTEKYNELNFKLTNYYSESSERIKYLKNEIKDCNKRIYNDYKYLYRSIYNVILEGDNQDIKIQDYCNLFFYMVFIRKTSNHFVLDIRDVISMSVFKKEISSKTEIDNWFNQLTNSIYYRDFYLQKTVHFELCNLYLDKINELTNETLPTTSGANVKLNWTGTPAELCYFISEFMKLGYIEDMQLTQTALILKKIFNIKQQEGKDVADRTLTDYLRHNKKSYPHAVMRIPHSENYGKE